MGRDARPPPVDMGCGASVQKQTLAAAKYHGGQEGAVGLSGSLATRVKKAIRGCRLFESTQEAVLSDIVTKRLMAPREYENGDIIIQQDDVPVESPAIGVVMDPIDGMFVLLEGAAQALKTYWFDPNGLVVYDYRVGKDRMGDYFGEGDFLGVRSHPTQSRFCLPPRTAAARL